MPKALTLDEVYREIEWVQEHIQLKRWKPHKHASTFGHRSGNQILASRQTNYMNHCADQTLALLTRLQKDGLTPRLIIQEYVSPHTQKPTLHFGLELKVNGRTYTAEFQTGKKATVYEGKYDPARSTPRTTTIRVHSFPTHQFKPGQSLLAFLGLKKRSSLVHLFPSFTESAIRSTIASMKKKNSPALHASISRKKPTLRKA